jgi:hypothetical protein
MSIEAQKDSTCFVPSYSYSEIRYHLFFKVLRFHRF